MKGFLMNTISETTEEIEQVSENIRVNPLNWQYYQDLLGAFFNEQLLDHIFRALILSLIIIVFGLILLFILNRIIEKAFTIKMRSKFKGNEKRNRTLVAVIKNIVKVFVWFVIIMMVLETFSLPIRTLLAGAGVVGLAIGFGAQSLVKDVITGFFIILENQFDKGDFVRVNTSGATIAEGEVKSMGLRSSRIQGWEGETYFIPNGTINEVVNFSRTNTIAMLDMAVSVEEDLEEVSSHIENFIDEYWQTDEVLVARPTYLGLNSIENGEAFLRIMLETEPMEHFGALRRMRMKLKQYLIKNDVSISIPKVNISQISPKAKGES